MSQRNKALLLTVVVLLAVVLVALLLFLRAALDYKGTVEAITIQEVDLSQVADRTYTGSCDLRAGVRPGGGDGGGRGHHRGDPYRLPQHPGPGGGGHPRRDRGPTADRGGRRVRGHGLLHRHSEGGGECADRRGVRGFCHRQVVPFGPSQVGTCDVVSRPVPGGDQAFSRESPDARVAGRAPPPPFFYGPLVPTRSFWRWCHIVSILGLLRGPCTCPDLGRFFSYRAPQPRGFPLGEAVTGGDG